MAKIIPISAIKHIQVELRKEGLYSGNIDGIRTVPNKLSMTDAGIDKALEKRQAELKLDPTESTYKSWTEKRKAVGYFQLLLKDANFEAGPADGYWGPQTDVAYQQFSGKLDKNWRDEMDKKPSAPSSPLLLNPNNWPRESTASVSAFYGPPGNPPLTLVEVPWTMKLSWDRNTRVKRVSVHPKVADSLSRVFQEVAQTYTAKEITEYGLDIFGGGFNPRKKRGGTSWSMHAWGIALDFDPDRNQLTWGRDKAFLARPELDRFWAAWEREGWTSLGRKKNFDWMHVQATHG
jgi:hypothetical protein